MNKTAIHESGHAVACCRLTPSRYVGWVSIIPNHEEGYAGAHAPAESWDFDAAAAQQVVLYMCAGYAACIAAGVEPATASEGCDSDFEQAKELISSWRLAPFEEQVSQAVALMRQPENLRAVARVTADLMEHRLLFYDEIDILIDVADGEASEEDLAWFRVLSDAHARRAGVITAKAGP